MSDLSENEEGSQTLSELLSDSDLDDDLDMEGHSTSDYYAQTDDFDLQKVTGKDLIFSTEIVRV